MSVDKPSHRLAEQLGQLHVNALGLTLQQCGAQFHAGAGEALEVVLPFAAAGIHAALREQLAGELATLDAALAQQPIDIVQRVPAPLDRPGDDTLVEAGHIVAIASGKGGVGKSATAVNLALALQREGASVGILDADIYGPSQPMMLGLPPEQKPEVRDGKFFEPVIAHGLQSMSMGYLVTEQTPMVWRGPMASGALTQMIRQTLWQGLDYLLVDMPPGTGDIQLTLAQQVPVTGSVIVTTPQNIALLDAKKGIEMFRKVNIPCLGVVENMATHICSNCGHVDHVFGADGGQRIAAEYEVPLLGSLPLDREIRESLDRGEPTVAIDPDGALSQQYRHIARRFGIELARSCATERPRAPKITVSDS